LRLTTDGHKASRGLSATAELCSIRFASLLIITNEETKHENNNYSFLYEA